MSWRFIILALAGTSVLGAVYLLLQARRFFPGFTKKHPVLSWLAALPVLLVPGLFALCFNVFTCFIVLLHLVLFWLLCDCVGRLVNRVRGKKPGFYAAGLCALGLTVVYLGFGWFFAHHVCETRYTFQTDKNLGAERLRIAALADAHLGITLSGEDFAAQTERIAAAKPDLVAIVGDFVDDDTSKEDMLRACEALGTLDAACPVFYVYGNHDRGYYRYRDFTGQELRDALTANGVTVLEDDAVSLNEHVTLIGRKDRSTGRLSAQELTAGVGGYTVILDHQPNDYENEAAAGADLVISGHTHGGHIFPAGLIGILSGANDRTYGTERRGGTTFVVTSGISGWAIPFKTGAISEYVVIDVEQERK